jgi:polyvinyl alcohol dehydrogenase (cytochrome)
MSSRRHLYCFDKGDRILDDDRQNISTSETGRLKMPSAFVCLVAALWMMGCSAEPKTIPTDSSEPTISALIEAELNAEAQKLRLNHPGRQLYIDNCASCHEGGGVEAPTREAMALQGSEAIVRTLAFGIMQVQAAHLNPIERRDIAEYLGDPTAESAAANAEANMCQTDYDPGQALWTQWGGDKRNTRYAADSTLDKRDVSSLELKWAFGFPGAARARSQPAVTTTSLFTGSQSGLVYALDRNTGCIHWTYAAPAEVRIAPVIEAGPLGTAKTIYVADFDANVHAIDARTGTALWVRAIKDHPAGTITGSPVLHEGQIFVPMSSLEVVDAYTPEYECCTFRGGITALDSTTGERLWRMHTVDAPQARGLNSVGAKQFGPSGAPIWNSPTIDVERGLLYVGTGENYSSPASDMSDSILAVSMKTGRIVWVTQTIEGDAWNAACGPYGTTVNCPEEDGPDFDFGAPPILTTLSDGREILLAGQKSGMIYGLDPNDDGRVLWEQRKGMGGFNGGIHWGMAVRGDHLFVGIADTPGNRFNVGENRQGMHVKNVRTEELVWSVLEPDTCDEPTHYCRTAVSAPPTVTDAAVFVGTLNGIAKAYDVDTGETLWTFDSLRSFETVNGLSVTGGSIDSSGPVAVGEQLIINSGYDKFGQIPGQALLVFGPKDISFGEGN